MQLSITGRHIDVTDALRNYVATKVNRLERHYDHITNVQVVLAVSKMGQDGRGHRSRWPPPRDLRGC